MSNFVWVREDDYSEDMTRAEALEVGVTYEEVEESYRELLDEVYGDVEICGMTFNAGRALEELDPIAFRCSVSDYSASGFVEVYLPDLAETREGEDD